MNAHGISESNDFHGSIKQLQRRIMKNKVDINRALRDEDYFANLSEQERALVPLNPAGAIEISDADLAGVAGGWFFPPGTNTHAVCCT
jgi:mersacidin/lichenicidin family type 2 lantibiotic